VGDEKDRRSSFLFLFSVPSSLAKDKKKSRKGRSFCVLSHKYPERDQGASSHAFLCVWRAGQQYYISSASPITVLGVPLPFLNSPSVKTGCFRSAASSHFLGT
jgi:hypothetical protein